jgi:hypothetical protein
VARLALADALVAMGLIPEPHPLAVGLRTVNFLRDLDLDTFYSIFAESYRNLGTPVFGRSLFGWGIPICKQRKSTRALILL